MTRTATVPEFTTYAIAKLTRNFRQIERCVRMLTDAQIWRRPNEHSNSVGNLVLHLTGNVRQWICAHVGGDNLARNRQAEFAEQGPLPRHEIVGKLKGTIERACDVIRGLDAENLRVRHMIQGYDVSTQTAIFHVVEHFSWHSGQIVFATKEITDLDVSLYDASGRILDDPYPEMP